MTVDHSEETREVYHKQHIRVVNDQKAMKRFINMFSTDYFGVKRDFFKGKKILDAGCGDTAKLIIALYKMGARDLNGLELGTDFIPIAQKSLEHHDVPLEDVNFTSGNILELPYPDNEFDFVSCHGVMIHLNTIDEVKKAFSELTRVTKNNGYLYTVFGSVGGLFEDAINPALREYYRTNQEFKKFIDEISPKDFQDVFKIIKNSPNNALEEWFTNTLLQNFFDEEYCVMIQNIIQAPIRLKVNEDLIRELYEKNNFRDLTRLKRFVKRENIRKFFAPLHYERDSRLSKLLYGGGNLEFLGRKA